MAPAARARRSIGSCTASGSAADGRLPRDALLRNPVADALDDGWWHGCLGRPLGVQC